jgi:hypothetical protein
MGSIDDLALWTTADALLDCVSGELAQTAAGAPTWQSVVAGQTIPDEACHCGQLSVHIPSMWPSDAFPAPVDRPRGQRCDAMYTVADFVVTVLRCAPQPDEHGRPPLPPELTAAAQLDFHDRYAMRKGATCCFGTRLWTMGDHLAVGEMGACVGSELHCLVALNNCEGC